MVKMEAANKICTTRRYMKEMKRMASRQQPKTLYWNKCIQTGITEQAKTQPIFYVSVTLQVCDKLSGKAPFF